MPEGFLPHPLPLAVTRYIHGQGFRPFPTLPTPCGYDPFTEKGFNFTHQKKKLLPNMGRSSNHLDSTP
jgi:hypothetical protein